MEIIRPFFPFSGISYLVRYGREAEVTIKGPQWRLMAHLRRSSNGSNERFAVA
jgi:hypothetical protein